MTKFSPSTFAVPPPIPARNPIIDDITAMNNHIEKSHKQSEQPPELPPKTTRFVNPTSKFASPNKPAVASNKINPCVNKENQDVATPKLELMSSSHEAKLVQRHKSKNNRRKMTEEEAINELG